MRLVSRQANSHEPMQDGNLLVSDAVDVLSRHLQVGGGVLDHQAPVHGMLEHVCSMLGPGVGRGRAVEPMDRRLTKALAA